MNVQHKAAILIGCALCWMFIGLAVLCYVYAAYVILDEFVYAVTAAEGIILSLMFIERQQR